MNSMPVAAFRALLLLSVASLAPWPSFAEDVKKAPLYARVKAALDAVPAIDTHDHLRPFEDIPGLDETDKGRGMTLHSIWQGSYYTWINPLSSWPAGTSFDEWWRRAEHDFDDARATSFYRYLLPAFRDLYGVDFDTINAKQASELDDQIFENYQDPAWIHEVVKKRANIELMLIDTHWAPYDFVQEYPFGVSVFNVNSLIQGFHPDRCPEGLKSPYTYARKRELNVGTFDDYLALAERMFEDASAAGAACPKCTLAYQRSLSFDKVSKEEAARAFGRRPDEVPPQQAKAFEDFLFGKVCDLAARHGMPFQIHTGWGRIQGSNPLLLVDAIEAHPETTFILFHGGFPWIGETGVIGKRYAHNVRIDFNWLPILSYSTSKRALHEWLEVMPSNHLMWGGDCASAEGIYGATRVTRDCIAEVLAEKVAAGQLREEHALHIGQQILRDNALETFPKLRRLTAK